MQILRRAIFLFAIVFCLVPQSQAGVPTVAPIDGVGADFYPRAGEGPQDAIRRCLLQYGTAHLLPGTYQFTAPLSIPYNDVQIVGGKSAKLIPSTSSVGLFSITGDGVAVEGVYLQRTTVVADQSLISLTGKRARIENVTIEEASTTSTTANPMIGILGTGISDGSFDNIHVLPAYGTVGIKLDSSYRCSVDDMKVTNNVAQDTLDSVTSRDCWAGIWLENTEFIQVDGFQAYGIGNPLAGYSLITGQDYTSLVRPQALIWVRGSGVGTEDGHTIISNAHIENCCASGGLIRIEGSQGWVDILNPQLGLANSGLYALGDAGIKVTRYAADSRNSCRVSINGGMIHNLGVSFGTAATIYLFRNGSNTISPAAGIAVTGTNTFALSSGTWTTVPQAGDWISTANFTNAINNGSFKVASVVTTSGSATITVDSTTSPALTNEAAGGNETINGRHGFEAAGVWLEHCSDVDIRGLRIVDQRHQWGIAIDTTTVRGVVLDGITFHAGSGAGSYAPIRLPTGDLPDQTASLNDAEGLVIGSVFMKKWGTTPKPVVSATVQADATFLTLTTTAPTIGVGNAPYFAGILGNSASNYDGVSADMTTANLSFIRRL